MNNKYYLTKKSFELPFLQESLSISCSSLFHFLKSNEEHDDLV